MNGNDRSILGLTGLGHGLVHAHELSIPILLGLWMVEFGVGSAIMGAIVAAGYACYGIGAVPAGVLTDAFGSTALLVACLLGMGGSFLLLALAPGPIVLGVALVCWGSAASIYHPAGLRLISTGVTERGTGFAYHGIAGNLGIAVGPLLTAMALLVLEWRAVVGLLAIPALLAAGYAALVSVDETAAVSDRAPEPDRTSVSDSASESERVPESSDEATGADDGAFGGADTDGGDPSGSGTGSGGTERPSIADVLTDTRVLFAGGFLLVFPIVVLEGFFYRGVLTFLPDVLADEAALGSLSLGSRALDPAEFVYTGLLFVGMAGQYVGGRLTDRMSPERPLVGAFAALVVLSVAFVPALQAGLAPLVAVSFLLGFVLFGEQPLLQAVVADYSGSDVRGLSYGYMFLGVFGVGSLGAAVSGAVLAYGTHQVLFLVLALVPLLAAAGTTVLVGRRRQPVE
ncbi:MFS transporter [Halovivax cerinus]|uniref:MFS transporter n=1 Tax=Halovivax cerinus TaxID=1487865 RepID=A0ABD5NP75_9EURY|nr:MFS transporter [Halovivax cerinus]